MHGWSALHIAATNGEASVVKALVDLSSEINITLKDKVRRRLVLGLRKLYIMMA